MHDRKSSRLKIGELEAHRFSCSFRDFDPFRACYSSARTFALTLRR